jgi:DNA-binding NarL/FixJ family response regulator
MDIGMSDLNGIEATRQIVAECPSTRVIGLSMHSDRQYVGGMLEAGASGYLLKDCAFEELETAIRTVLDNRTYLSPGVADVVVRNYVRGMPTEAPSRYGRLTPREREVLQLLAEGKSTKQAASVLRVSVKTVESHRRNLMEKLDIHSVAELTKYAIREGLTSLDT